MITGQEFIPQRSDSEIICKDVPWPLRYITLADSHKSRHQMVYVDCKRSDSTRKNGASRNYYSISKSTDSDFLFTLSHMRQMYKDIDTIARTIRGSFTSSKIYPIKQCYWNLQLTLNPPWLPLLYKRSDPFLHIWARFHLMPCATHQF